MNELQITATTSPKWIYTFSHKGADGNADMKSLLGGKGANLAEMANLGLPVPPGFTITTEVCAAYYANQCQLPDEIKSQAIAALHEIGNIVGAEFGNKDNPLLVSIRSGARASMPGMMDTILNLGLNDETVEGLARHSGDRRFAYDSYRRFIQMYSDVVLGVAHHFFEDILETYKGLNNFENDTDLGAEDWLEVIAQYKDMVEENLSTPFPQDLNNQLWGAILAVFGSWMNARAHTYRTLHNIPESWGTAVNVQAMVFGNMGPGSATGVAFTRNPSTGEKTLYGEFLVNAQGEDVVAGIRTPQNLTEEASLEAGDHEPSLEKLMPVVFSEFRTICDKLEARYRDMQDIEFTIQNGKLWMLQTRVGKRTTKAAIKIAVDLADEGVISREDAVMRIDPAALDQLLHPTLDPNASREVLTRGLPASPGATSGQIVFDPDEAEKLKAQGLDTILVRIETSPEDIHGMYAANAILTTRGGMTSHAAVVARGMGRPCISGAGLIRIDYQSATMTIGEVKFSQGDILTIDGTSGEVIKGKVQMRQAELSDDFSKLMVWADDARRMKVRANAETPRDARQARDFGGEGIGLCRTEHMFFETSRIQAVREMILAESKEMRQKALDKILPMQRQDFIELFEIMGGLPITIRLLDPPLHEFLPHKAAEISEVAKAIGMELEKVEARVKELKEFNPMLGHRGCRIAISYPEITEMQTRAIFEAASEVFSRNGWRVVPEIMIPLISMKAEFDFLKERILRVINDVQKERDIKIDYQIGTMIELPRAAILAGEIAKSADFFSFGTNDLTQTVYGLSRDDAAPILNSYTTMGLLEKDPFITLDQEGVGALVEMAAKQGRQERADLKLGICGEHGGDPDTIHCCERIGLDYISCSPFRVPIARLAAAQAALKTSRL